MRPLASLLAILLLGAACTAGVGSSPEVSAPESATAAASRDPAPPSPSVTPSEAPTASPQGTATQPPALTRSEEGVLLLAGATRKLGSCVLAGGELPAGALAGMVCAPASRPVARVTVFSYRGPDNLTAWLRERTLAAGASLEGNCYNGVAGFMDLTPERLPDFPGDKAACYLAKSGRAVTDFVIRSGCGWGGYTIAGTIRGTGDDPLAVFEWALPERIGAGATLDVGWSPSVATYRAVCTLDP